jgi:hypothetical protein
LQRDPLGGGIARLVDIDLHRHRHAGQRPNLLAVPQPGVYDVGGRQCLGGTIIDHRVDRAVDVIQPVEGRIHGLPRRDLARANQTGKLGRRQFPQPCHLASSLDSQHWTDRDRHSS